MESVPIQRVAIRPHGRPRHALMPVLLRVAAIAGFAFAGWIALSALTGAASAEERPARPVQAGDQISATLLRLTSEPVRYLTSGQGAGAMTGEVRAIGDDPVRYVRSKRQDLFAGKDQVVRQVRELTGAAGVPGVPFADMRFPDVRAERPGGTVQPVAGTRPVQPPAAPERPRARDGAGAAQRASEGAAAAARHTTAAPATVPDREAGGCPRCGGDDHRAQEQAPAQPAQDAPQGGGSAGGHPFAPVADLPSRRSAAVPSAVEASPFERTALTDVAAPGGPSVVPD